MEVHPAPGQAARGRRQHPPSPICCVLHDGNIDAVIEALPSCVDDAHPQLYGPITVGEHIQAKLAGSRGLKLNEQGTDREAARVRAAAY